MLVFSFSTVLLCWWWSWWPYCGVVVISVVILLCVCCVSVVFLLCFCCGSVVVLLWFCCGSVVALLWFCCGSVLLYDLRNGDGSDEMTIEAIVYCFKVKNKIHSNQLIKPPPLPKSLHPSTINQHSWSTCATLREAAQRSKWRKRK